MTQLPADATLLGVGPSRGDSGTEPPCPRPRTFRRRAVLPWHPRDLGATVAGKSKSRVRFLADARLVVQSSVPPGQVAEWLNAPVLKTGIPATVSWVRIPPCPLLSLRRRTSILCGAALRRSRPRNRRATTATVATADHVPVTARSCASAAVVSAWAHRPRHPAATSTDARMVLRG